MIEPAVHGDERGYFMESYNLNDMKEAGIVAEICYKVSSFYHPGDEGGIVWNDPGIGIIWPGVKGEYPGNGNPGAYTMEDGSPLTINERDQNWGRLAGEDL